MNIEKISPNLNRSPVPEEAETSPEILHRDDLPLGGFAGLREHRLVMDPRAWGPGAGETASWSGASLAYLIEGSGWIAGRRVEDGDLVRVRDLRFEALADAVLIVAHVAARS